MMAKYVQNEVEYYYDSHPTVEDLMGETSFHADLVHYLMEVLRWLFREQLCAIYENLNFYQTLDPQEYPVAPDIAIIKGVAPYSLRSWAVGRTGPAPQVVFEIASKETWRNDLREKPFKYAQMGVQEYFLYDPETPMHLKYMGKRLVGWQFNRDTQAMAELVPDSQGHLWSSILESFLVADGAYLRLYDSDYRLRLTGEEAREQDQRASEQRAQLFEQKAQQSEQKAHLSEERARILEEKLRSLGVNPDEL